MGDSQSSECVPGLGQFYLYFVLTILSVTEVFIASSNTMIGSGVESDAN
jgi:hypothetical protein